ncbi:MAG: GNAT family N-acetyltransferase [Clostridia bacterium]|nr:GNAT family N-acetyltransferase [Clostridia bacterium]
MMKKYDIRPIGIDEYPACTALFGGQCPFAETCLAQQKAGNREPYALFENGEIAAECHLVYDNPEYGTVPGRRAYLSRMVTRKEYRRKGYGEKIARFILDLAKEKGYEEIALGVNCDNAPALRLYEKLGFSVYETAEDDYGRFYRMEEKL